MLGIILCIYSVAVPIMYNFNKLRRMCLQHIVPIDEVLVYATDRVLVTCYTFDHDASHVCYNLLAKSCDHCSFFVLQDIAQSCLSSLLPLA